MFIDLYLNFKNMSNISQTKIRFGVIGTSSIVDTVLRAARLDPRFELVAVYSRTQESANIFAEKHHISHTFVSLEDMAQSPLIDAVYIASPNSLHSSQSILFMKHGKHVLCEKPFASNVKETKAMIDASKTYNVTLMEAMKPTLTPNFKVVMENLHSLGTIRRYFASYCQYSSRYDSLKEGVVLNAFNPALSNGAAVDIGIYTIYPMVVLFGRPKKVSATGILLSTGVDGQGAVNFEYENMNATILYSKIADSQLSTEIQGEKGLISLDRINTIRDIRICIKDKEEQHVSYFNYDREYLHEIAEFIDLVQSGRRESVINSHENSLITMEILDEIRQQLGVVFPADSES